MPITVSVTLAEHGWGVLSRTSGFVLSMTNCGNRIWMRTFICAKTFVRRGGFIVPRMRLTVSSGNAQAGILFPEGLKEAINTSISLRSLVVTRFPPSTKLFSNRYFHLRNVSYSARLTVISALIEVKIRI